MRSSAVLLVAAFAAVALGLIDIAEPHRIVSKAAEAFDPLVHVARLQSLARSVSSNSGRNVHILESCTDAQLVVDLSVALQACAAITTLNATISGIKASFEAACGTSCPSAMASFSARWQSCVSTATLSSIVYVQVSCERDNDNHYCGSTLTDASLGQCEGRTMATCGAPYFCRWAAGTCLTNLTTSYLNSVCTVCVQRIINKLSNFSSTTTNFLLESARYTQLITCSRVDSTYCLTSIESVLEDSANNGGFLSNATYATVCGSSVQTRCLNKVSEGISSSSLASASAALTTCAALYVTDTLVDANCVPAFVTVWRRLDIEARERRYMCQRNDNGTYCLSFMPRVKGSCVVAGTCSSTCQTSTAALVNEMRCCVGAVEESVGAQPPFPGLLLPLFNRVNPPTNAPTTAPVTVVPQINVTAIGQARLFDTASLFLSVRISGCAPTTLNTYLWSTCPISFPSSRARSYQVNLVWGALTAALKVSLAAAIAEDIARTLGVTMRDVVNGTLTEDASVRIVLRDGTTVNGCRFTFDLQASTSVVLDGAASSFDSMSSLRGIALTSTSTVVTRSCESTCVGKDGVASLNPDAQTSGSGAAAVTAVLAILVAAISAVL